MNKSQGIELEHWTAWGCSFCEHNEAAPAEYNGPVLVCPYDGSEMEPMGDFTANPYGQRLRE